MSRNNLVTFLKEWVIDEDKNATVNVYRTELEDVKTIRRAVIMLPGKNRDSDNHFLNINDALNKAMRQDRHLKRSEISLMVPCWLSDTDSKTHGHSQANHLTWGENTWMRGNYNQGPAAISKSVSSFTVLDVLISHYMDRDIYPNLSTVVLAGHSAGGQMVQRYAALRPSCLGDSRLHFWVANPGTLLWLTSDRPVENPSCEEYDNYKYGLAGDFVGYAKPDVQRLGREGIVKRYRSRTVHYAWGLRDTGAGGDTRCPAKMQGASRLERGQNFVEMLKGMDDGIPSTHTIDWVEGVGHDTAGMLEDKASLQRLFGCCQ